MTQDEVAKAIGIAQTSVKDIEIGKTKSPSALTLIKLAKFFGVHAEWLLTGKGAKHPVETYTDEEAGLLLIYRALSPEGQAYILGRARGIYQDEHGRRPDTEAPGTIIKPKDRPQH